MFPQIGREPLEELLEAGNDNQADTSWGRARIKCGWDNGWWARRRRHTRIEGRRNKRRAVGRRRGRWGQRPGGRASAIG